MKKYLALILGVIFVLGFAASAFAIHAEIPSESQAVVAKGLTQITLGGDLRFRGEITDNTTDFNSHNHDAFDNPIPSDHKAYYDGRVRLSLDAQVTPNTKGFVMVEAANGPIDTAYTWGTTATDNSGTGAYGLFHAGDAKKATLNILEAWIQYSGAGLLGFPVGIKVGHMPLALGNSLFFDHALFGDDAILVFSEPMKDLHIVALTAKFREGDLRFNDDSTTYVGLFDYSTKEFGISGDVTYVDDQNGLGALDGTGLEAKDGLHFWNFGLRGNVNIGGLMIKADGEVQTGKIEEVGVKDVTPDIGDLKFKGWAVMAGLGYKLEPVTVSADFAYGSGGDSGNGFQNSDGDIKGLVTSLSNTQHYTYVYEYRTVNACGNIHGGICNTMYVRAGAQGDITKDLNGLFNVYWLHANKDASVNTNGLVNITDGTSKSIGWELDSRLAYKLDRNLTYYVEGGYLFAGDFWKVGGKDPDNAYAVRHGIQLSF